MPTKPLQAGSSVISECYKCKGPTDHVVIAMVDGSVAKVECKFCGGRHAFRPFKKGLAGKKKTGAKRPASKKKASVVTEEWEKRTAGADPSQIKPYAMTERFEAGDLIEHSVFGLGFVQRTIRPDKIEVLFKDSLKTLRCQL